MSHDLQGLMVVCKVIRMTPYLKLKYLSTFRQQTWRNLLREVRRNLSKASCILALKSHLIWTFIVRLEMFGSVIITFPWLSLLGEKQLLSIILNWFRLKSDLVLVRADKSHTNQSPRGGAGATFAAWKLMSKFHPFHHIPHPCEMGGLRYNEWRLVWPASYIRSMSPHWKISQCIEFFKEQLFSWRE